MKASIVEMEGLLRGKCIPAKMLVNESLAEYLVRQFDALHERAEKAERANAAQGDHIDQQQTRIDWLEAANSGLGKALCAAKSEIARRDAAAGEPDGYIFCHPSGKNFWSVSHDDTAGHNGVKPFYFAAPPAVLPHDFITHQSAWRSALERAIELEPESHAPDSDEKGYWKHQLDAFDRAYAELGAQQQKVVVLPEWWESFGDDVMSLNDVKEALDAAGVKWEVKK